MHATHTVIHAVRQISELSIIKVLPSSNPHTLNSCSAHTHTHPQWGTPCERSRQYEIKWSRSSTICWKWLYVCVCVRESEGEQKRERCWCATAVRKQILIHTGVSSGNKKEDIFQCRVWRIIWEYIVGAGLECVCFNAFIIKVHFGVSQNPSKMNPRKNTENMVPSQ